MLRSKGEIIFEWIVRIFLILLCCTMLYPILFVFGRSFMDTVYMAKNPLALIPMVPSTEGYEFIFGPTSYIARSYLVTIVRTVIGTLANLLFTSLLAYALSKKYFKPRTPITLIIVFTMWFSGGMIPNYLLIKDLGLIDSFWVYIIPGLISAWNLFIMRNFFSSIPYDVEESAKIDGAGDWVIFARIYVPLSKAVFATLALFYAVDHWNAWYDSMLYVNSPELRTLQLMLREVLNSANVNSLRDPTAIAQKTPPTEVVKFASVVVTTVPILCIYPFLQQFFVKGVMVGSLKG